MMLLCVVGEYSRVNRKHEDAAALTIIKIELENNDSHNLLAHPIPSHPSYTADLWYPFLKNKEVVWRAS